MSEPCTFTIAFHSPFRVGAAYGIDGVDLAVDLHDALPGDHLKGVMRASADQLAAARFVDPVLVGAVFGTIRTPCPWTWFGARPDDLEYSVQVRNRVHVDPVTHAATKDMLVSGAQAWAMTATFEICPLEAVEDVKRHQALLRLAARHTQHLGSWRRRGLGWVTIAPTVEAPSASDDLDLLMGTSTGGRR